MDFSRKPVIGCIHLLPTPGSPEYDGDMARVSNLALEEAAILRRCGVDALIVENFRDGPFFPEAVPVETVAAISGVAREIVMTGDVPVGIAVLRNDAEAAIAIATAVGAQFVRINVHIGAVLAEQGIVQGRSFASMRLRANLRSNVAIWADARVKHSFPFVYSSISQEIRDLNGRADAIQPCGPHWAPLKASH